MKKFILICFICFFLSANSYAFSFSDPTIEVPYDSLFGEKNFIITDSLHVKKIGGDTYVSFWVINNLYGVLNKEDEATSKEHESGITLRHYSINMEKRVIRSGHNIDFFNSGSFRVIDSGNVYFPNLRANEQFTSVSSSYQKILYMIAESYLNQEPEAFKKLNGE